MSPTPTNRIPVEAALRVLAELRDDRHLVVTNQGSARLWPRLSQHPCDFNYNPSTMGGAIALGLGLALARPQREVVVISGDGSLLMSLGSLVTVRDSGVTNLSIVLLENGIYEVTGRQRTPASQGEIAFADLAQAAGFSTATRLQTLATWQEQAAHLLSAAGPRFICLQVNEIQNDCLQDASEPMTDQLPRLRRALS